MITYTVSYKKIGLFSFWKKIKNVYADGILESNTHRYFINSEEERFEIPIGDIMFKFGKGRFYRIKQNMEAEAGQSIPIKQN